MRYPACLLFCLALAACSNPSRTGEDAVPEDSATPDSVVAPDLSADVEADAGPLAPTAWWPDPGIELPLSEAFYGGHRRTASGRDNRP